MKARTLFAGVTAVALMVLLCACEETEKKAAPAEKKAEAKPECKARTAQSAPEVKPAPKASCKAGAKGGGITLKSGATWDLEGKIAPEIETAQWFNAEKPMTLQEFRKKKFVLLEFWFTKCPHCQEQVEHMQDIYNRFTGPLFQVITVVSDLKDNKETVEKFIKERNITFPVAIDKDAKTFSKYAMRCVPFCYIVNRYGYVIWQGHPHYLKTKRISDMLKEAAAK
ncbi:MAG: TlpA family protein disulfide reductase [Planctomycetes bacterium]|nr:TlpA family protein disulfide reductase [Planctomycetota bacterium]